MTNRKESSGEITRWLVAARAGSNEAVGQMLDACRQYLLLVANQELDGELRGKVGPSDVVQDTFLEAQRDFARFRGNSEEELFGWLRRILRNNLANIARHYRVTSKRQVAREVSLAEVPLDYLQEQLPPVDSPSTRAQAEEESKQIDRAIGQLPGPFREALRLRHQERLTFEQMGQKMGRSAKAARKLWGRAVEQLQEFLEPPHES